MPHADPQWRSHGIDHNGIPPSLTRRHPALLAAQLSSLSALLSGFALVAMCQMQIPNGVNGVQLIVFGTITSAAVGCTLFSMLTSTLVLVAVVKYNPKVSRT